MAKGGSESSTSIPDELKPYYTTLYTEGIKALRNVPANAYEGDRTAGYNKNLRRAESGFTNLGGQTRGIGNSTINLANQTIAGDFLHPNSNPYLNGQIQAAIDPVADRFEQHTLPMMQSAAVASGAQGGPRSDIFNAVNARQSQEAQYNLSKSMIGENYARERQYQTQAPGMLAQGVGLNALSPGFFQQAGQMQQQQQQNEINAKMALHKDRIQAPFQGLNQYASLISGINPGSTTTNSQQGIGQPGSALMGAGSGALMGATAFPANPAIGAVGGGLVGLLGGLIR